MPPSGPVSDLQRLNPPEVTHLVSESLDGLIPPDTGDTAGESIESDGERDPCMMPDGDRSEGSPAAVRVEVGQGHAEL